MTLSFSGHSNFVQTMSKDLDYSSEIMKMAYDILIRRKIVNDEMANQFLDFINKVNSFIQISKSESNEIKIQDNSNSMELETNEDELEKLYVSELEDKRFDSSMMKVDDMSDKYLHHYASNIQASGIGALSGSRMQRIVKVL